MNKKTKRKPRLSREAKHESIGFWLHEDLWIQNRTIFIGSAHADDGRDNEIDAGTSEGVIKSLMALEALDSKAPITVIMNNPGGYLTHSLAIYDAFRLCPCQITVKAFGECESGATLILQGADIRLLSENIEFMVHDPWSGTDGTARSAERWVEQLKKQRKLMYRIYASRSGRSPEFWEEKLTHDFIISAREAVELGLADGIIPPISKTYKPEEFTCSSS